MKKIQTEILEASSRIRTHPDEYISILEDMVGWFKGNTMNRPGRIGLDTEEGPKAVKEAIKFLKKQKALCALTPSEKISKASADHATELSKLQALSHTSKSKIWA